MAKKLIGVLYLFAWVVFIALFFAECGGVANSQELDPMERIAIDAAKREKIDPIVFLAMLDTENHPHDPYVTGDCIINGERVPWLACSHGLFQETTETAKQFYDRRKGKVYNCPKVFSVKMLYNAKCNASLAAVIFKHLLKRASYSSTLAVRYYNEGPRGAENAISKGIDTTRHIARFKGYLRGRMAE